MVITPNGPGGTAVGIGVEGDDRSSDEDGAERGVMSHERHSTDDIIADGESRSDDKGKREVESYVSTASLASAAGLFVMPIEWVAVPLFAHRRLCWAPAKRSVVA
jgi:hypothetical protein